MLYPKVFMIKRYSKRITDARGFNASIDRSCIRVVCMNPCIGGRYSFQKTIRLHPCSTHLPYVIIHGLEKELVVGSVELSLKVSQCHFSRALADLHQVRRLFVVHVVYHFRLLHDGCLTRLPAALCVSCLELLGVFSSSARLRVCTSTAPNSYYAIMCKKGTVLKFGADDTLYSLR